MFDFVRVATAIPTLKVGDVKFNTEKIIEKIDEAIEKKANLVAFPELSVTGYTCGDLFFQRTLLDSAKVSLLEIAECTRGTDVTVIIGAPLLIDGSLFNCAVVLSGGEVCGIVPKTYLPNYAEFLEKRWFSATDRLRVDSILASDLGITGGSDYEIPVGCDLVFSAGESLKFAIEICEDVWAPVSRGAVLSMSGAELIVNLSANGASVGRFNKTADVIKAESVKNICAYIYVSSGAGESTADSIFEGDAIICENGKVLESARTLKNDGLLVVSDLDMGKIKAERLKRTSFYDCADKYAEDVRVIYLDECEGSDGTLYKLKKRPFVPCDKNKCLDIFEIQASALARRLETINARPVIGVSGGLDSTLALLVCARAIDILGRDRTDILGVTMPGFGTTDTTKSNSIELMKALGVEMKTVSIEKACRVHFEDIAHDETEHNVVYENAQARERTQVLMDLANKVGGIVVGTGDLSEIALGWSTYNGDHMSMYAVNSGVAKTLIAPVLQSIVDAKKFDGTDDVLKSIISTPISPELLPPDENGKIAQKTEDLVGPYQLHDFFLYYAVKYGFTPEKIYHLARMAFSDEFDEKTIEKWLKNFYKRFFTQQFKRNCMPDGVKVGSVSLSPRGDFKMPSDASYSTWVE